MRYTSEKDEKTKADVAALERLRAVAARHQLEVQDVTPDGDCLYSALAIQLGRRSASSVRKELVTHIRNYPGMVSIQQFCSNTLNFSLDKTEFLPLKEAVILCVK